MAETKAALTKKKKLGYAFGIATESMLYNMYYTYFLTFLVQILKIEPYLAGIVIFGALGFYGMDLYDFLEPGDVLGESGYDIRDLPGANHNLGKLLIALQVVRRI